MALGEPNVKSVLAMSNAEQRITSLVLIGFTLLAAAICIVLLSSTLTQTRLSNLTIDGVEVTIRKLDSTAQLWAQHQNSKSRLARRLDLAENRRLELLEPLSAAEGNYEASETRISSALQGFYHTIAKVEPEFAKLIENKGYHDQFGKIRGEKGNLQNKYPQLADAISGIEGAYQAFLEAGKKRIEAKAQMAGPLEQIKALQKELDGTNARISEVFGLIKPALDQPNRIRVENAFLEIDVRSFQDSIEPSNSIFRRALASLQYKLLTSQPDLMTLFLVVFMGVLGSALQITHAFFIRGEAYTVGRYFQRLSVGALTALVIFIVAKAGIPIIAEPSRLTGEASINPYFVSFLAIISGLLSENAITYVQTQGTRLFGQAAGISRWARANVLADFNTQQLSLDTLARRLGTEPAVVEIKLKGEQELSAREQEVVALYMRGEPRDLFTDIPPR